jgi:uracil-DNA glycosylase
MSFRELRQEVVACTRCPRLTVYRQAVPRKRAFRHEEYWGRPVPGFGDSRAHLLIVGLAPAAHGANRTGRMFTGDGTDGKGSSDFLARALYRAGYANQPWSQRRDDGLALIGAYLTAVVRCAPPDNKPLRAELSNCRPYLLRELELLEDLQLIVSLGKIAYDQVLDVLAGRGAAIPRPRPPFAHGHVIDAGRDHPVLLASYHPSRQNTQTGRLTADMFAAVFETARRLMSAPR